MGLVTPETERVSIPSPQPLTVPPQKPVKEDVPVGAAEGALGKLRPTGPPYASPAEKRSPGS
jgi:hypothetical protein